jgi:hypothetical protein
MAMFLVETTHEPSANACMRSLDAAVAQGSHFITNIQWGCDDDVHKTWIFIEADTKAEVQTMIPPMDRPDSTIVQVRKFTAEEARQMHQKHDA